MSATDRPMDDVPAGLWKWIAGGLATLVTAGVAAFGGLFRWHAASLKQEVKDVLAEVKDLDKRTGRHLDDLWEVVNAERDAASRQRERNYTRLEQTPTRDEMQKGFERLEALMRGRG